MKGSKSLPRAIGNAMNAATVNKFWPSCVPSRIISSVITHRRKKEKWN